VDFAPTPEQEQNRDAVARICACFPDEYWLAREYHVERFMREAWVPRIAPVSPQLIRCFIAEKVLGLPKSY
jgi:hypothetical protein